MAANLEKVTVWDLDEVKVSFGDGELDVAKTPRWASTERLFGIHDDWPPPRVVGNVVHQIIPKSAGLSILSLRLSAHGPVSVSISQPETKHYHYFANISFSRDLLAYSVSNITLGKRSFVLCRSNGSDQLSLNFTYLPIPFMPYCMYFDAFSSRVVLYGNPEFYIGSFLLLPQS